MRLFPTRSAVDLAIAGAAAVLAGILLFQPAIVAWGGALIIGLSVARAVTLFNVARVRTAGFEMVWRGIGRSLRVSKDQPLKIVAEVRNRDTRAARYVQLRVISAPSVVVELEPGQGEVPAGGRLDVSVSLRARRVGRHGLFGLGLELRGSPGLFEVPLTFSNPFGLEVLPALAPVRRRAPQGNAALLAGARTSRRAGDATEFSEIRDHQHGDALKRVAWKASARRGKLLVRKYEHEERQVVWFLLDASVELWAGRVGAAPLDLAIDHIADMCRQHLRAGHEVGLYTLAARVVARVAAGRGAAHERRLLEALARTPGTLEPDRSGMDERAVAARALEHLRALTPTEAMSTSVDDVERIAELASAALAHAPFPDARVAAGSEREARLRSYLAAFGVDAPPRLEPRNPQTDACLAEVLQTLLRGRGAGPLVYVASPLPNEERWQELGPKLEQLTRQRARVRWLSTSLLAGLDVPSDAVGRVARTAARLRLDAERRSAELRLRRLGIRLASVPELESPGTRPEPERMPPAEALG